MAPASGITDVRIQNPGPAQTGAPFTFGQVFAPGDLARTDGLASSLPDGTVIPLQVDVKATHAEGSVRHAVISGVLPAIGAGATQTLTLARATPAPIRPATLGDLGETGLSSMVAINLAGVVYTASLADVLADPALVAWLSGDTVCEWIGTAPLKDATGAAHPRLVARFGVRWYPGAQKRARVEVGVENSKTWLSGSNYTYDVDVQVAGRSVYTKTGLTHYHHARWHQTFWWDGAPALTVQLNTAYLIASKAVPNYEQLAPAESALADLGKQVTAANTGPMTIGPVVAYMGTTGGRPDIGPLPNWAVMYLLSGDKRARDTMMAAADGSGSWSIHYRDEKTGQPVRADSTANRELSLHMNVNWKGPLPVPRIDPADPTKGASPYTHDTAHEPSLVYLPYLVTGEYYYLEELHFWAATNPLETGAESSGYGKGLVRWQQLRGQAWSLRTLAHTVYITPDDHPLKSYFAMQLDANIDFYHQTYVVGNPNKLGVYDSSGVGAFYVEASAPWQDDFLTWSFGHMVELGFTKAEPVWKWKTKYVVGRMTAPDFCWVQGAAYFLVIRENASSPVFDTFGQVYQKTFGGDMRNEDGAPASKELAQRFVNAPCGSAEQAAALSAINGNNWKLGRMSGYADSIVGYPANMQPALALAADSGVENAQKGWDQYMARVDKPDFTKGPQFNIIPRKVAGGVKPPVVPTPPAPPVVPIPPAPPAAKPGKLKGPSNKKLAKLNKLQVTAFNPATLGTVKIFGFVAASSTGIITVSDTALSAGKQYALKVEDEKGMVLDIMFPITATI